MESHSGANISRLQGFYLRRGDHLQQDEGSFDQQDWRNLDRFINYKLLFYFRDDYCDSICLNLSLNQLHCPLVVCLTAYHLHAGC